MKKPGHVFLAVGAAHLGGDGSLQALLHQKGITARRVNSAEAPARNSAEVSER